MGSDCMKADLRRYLQDGRDTLVWKLDGLSEYDARRPMTPTGTNLLGIVKHLAWVESGYFGETFGRPFPEQPPWSNSEEANVDMWATKDESKEMILDLYRRVWAHSDATIEATDLDARGRVPWWPKDQNEVTLHKILVHMVAETHRHAGQADILRESVDGSAGWLRDDDNLPGAETEWWAEYRGRLEETARSFSG